MPNAWVQKDTSQKEEITRATHRNVTSQCIFDKTDFNLRIFLNDVYVGSSFSKPIYFNNHLFERSEQDCV